MLFRLERNPEFSREPGAGGELGYQWIEVIAIEPRALSNPKPEDGYGEWCWKVCSNWYICRTEHGLTRFPAEDIWWALEETHEYVAVPPTGSVEGAMKPK